MLPIFYRLSTRKNAHTITGGDFFMIKYRKNNIDLMFEISDDNVASSTDCTGLIPFAPRGKYSYRSYEEIYDYMAKKEK